MKSNKKLGQHRIQYMSSLSQPTLFDRCSYIAISISITSCTGIYLFWPFDTDSKKYL